MKTSRYRDMVYGVMLVSAAVGGFAYRTWAIRDNPGMTLLVLGFIVVGLLMVISAVRGGK